MSSEIEQALKLLEQDVDDIPIDMGTGKEYKWTVIGELLLDELQKESGYEFMSDAGVDTSSAEDLDRFQDELLAKLNQVGLL